MKVGKTLRRLLERLPFKGLYWQIFSEDYYLLDKTLVTYAHDLLYTRHSADFLKDPRFAESYRLAASMDDGTLLKSGDGIEWRIHVLCWAAAHASRLEGAFVDCGCRTGIFARAIMNYIDLASSGRTYYMLDTFYGVDEKHSSEKEKIRQHAGYRKADPDALYRRVVETFTPLGDVRVIRGAVPDTLPQIDAAKVAFLSVDMNCVAPEVAALNYFWDRMTPGGVIILDDYGYAGSTNDQREAHNEFARTKGVHVLCLPTCQGMIIKS